MDRALTAAERAVIERLLSVEFREVEYFRAQVPHITVTSTCPCGCGTIDFEVDRERARSAPHKAWRKNSGLLVEGDARSWLMLSQHDGWLTDLEHVTGHGPNPEDLDAATIEPDVQVDEDWFGS